MSLEEKKIKETRKSNVGRPPKRIDYHKVEYWSRRLVSRKIIAKKIGFSERGLRKRAKKDANLRHALDFAYLDGLIALHIQQYETATGHHYTTCDDCGRRADYFELFSICPFCKSPHVRHSIIPGNTKLLIRLGALYLGQTRSSLMRQSKQPKIEEAKEMTRKRRSPRPS